MKTYRWLTHTGKDARHCSLFSSVQFSSVAQSCPTLCDPMNCSTPGLPVHQHLPEFISLTSIEWVMPSSHFILCCLLLFLPPILPSIRVFSNQSSLHMRWPKYWSFSFSIIPSKDPRADLLYTKGPVGSPYSPRDSQESSPTPQFKSISSLGLSFLHSPTFTSTQDHWKNHNLD